MKNIFLIIIITMTVIQLGESQTTVHLVHGLGGAPSDWSSLRNNFNSSCPSIVQVKLHNYDSFAGVNSAKSEVKTDVESFNNLYPTRTGSIGIGHSMGGVVLDRLQSETAADNSQIIDGYITVGTPNEGAKIANNLINNRVENYVYSGCKEVYSDVLRAMQRAPGINVLVGLLEAYLLIVEDVELATCGELVMNVMDNIASPTSQSVSDLREGTLNPSNSVIPSIGIWTAEESPIHWNFFDTAINNNTSYNVDVPASAEGALSTLKTIEDSAAAIGIFGGILTIFCPPCALIVAGAINVYQQAGDGIEWLEGSEQGYATLIGAHKIVGQVYAATKVFICNCQDANGKPIPCPEEGEIEPLEPMSPDQAAAFCPDPDCWVYQYHTHPVAKSFDSDAFIPEGSQRLAGAISNQRVDGPNHLEQTNSAGVTNEIANAISNPLYLTLYIPGCSL